MSTRPGKEVWFWLYIYVRIHKYINTLDIPSSHPTPFSTLKILHYTPVIFYSHLKRCFSYPDAPSLHLRHSFTLPTPLFTPSCNPFFIFRLPFTTSLLLYTTNYILSLHPRYSCLQNTTLLYTPTLLFTSHYTSLHPETPHLYTERPHTAPPGRQDLQLPQSCRSHLSLSSSFQSFLGGGTLMNCWVASSLSHWKTSNFMYFFIFCLSC